MAERTTSAEDTQHQHCQCAHTNVDKRLPNDGGLQEVASRMEWLVDAFDSTNKVSSDNAETIQLW